MKTKQQVQHATRTALGLLVLGYGVRHLPHVWFSEGGLFDLVWLAFGLLIVAAHLFYLMGVDREAGDPKSSRTVF